MVIFSSLPLNATKSSISFGHVKRQPQARWSPEVYEAVSENTRFLLLLIEAMKIVRFTSPLSDKSRLRHGRRHARISFLDLTLNLSILSFVLSPALLYLLFPLTSPNSPLSGSRLRSSPVT